MVHSSAEGERCHRTYRKPAWCGEAVAGLVVLAIVLYWFFITLLPNVFGDDPAEDEKVPVAKSDSEELLAPEAAKFPTPAEDPITVALKVAGSEGGTYAVREVTWEDDGAVENFGTIFNLGDPDFKGTLRSQPVGRTFDIDDGVWKDRDGKLQWDSILITVDKTDGGNAGMWEGALYAKLYVNDELVDCGNTDDGSSVRFQWSPPDGAAGAVTKMICWTYPGF